MADTSLNAIYLGNGFDIDSDGTSIYNALFSAGQFYETTVNFTGLAATGQQQIAESGVTANVQTDVPGGTAAFQDLQQVNVYQIEIVSDDGAGGTTTTTVDAQIFQTADGHLFLVPDVGDVNNLPTGEYESITVTNTPLVPASDMTIRESGGQDMNIPAGVAPGPAVVVDGEGTNEVMGLGYDDANGANDGGGNQITAGDDVIDGNGGNDTIEGAGGRDTIDGGIGDDAIYGDMADGSTYGALDPTNTDNLSDGTEGGTEALNIRAVELVTLANGDLIMITSERGNLEDGIASYQVDNDPSSATYGQILGGRIDTLREDSTPNSGAGFNAVENMEALTLSNGQTFLYTTDVSQQAIGVSEIGDDGSLTFVSQLTGFDQPQEMSVVEIGGNAFLMVLEGGSTDSLTTYQINGDGTLSLVETQNDGSGATENFLNNGNWNNTSLLESFTNSAGETFVIAGGDEDGISLWTMNSSGNLSFENARGDGQSGAGDFDPQGNELGRDLVSPATMGLGNVDAAIFAEIDGQTYLFAGGGDGDIDIFRIDIDTVNADGTFDLTMVGQAANVAIGVSALETLQTDDGTVLVVGSEDTGLDFHSIVVNSDGTVGLTLSDTVPDSGAQLADSEDIDVEGGILVSASDDESGVALIDTGLNPEPQFANNDTIDGGAGNDVIFGQGGADSIAGGTGNDAIYGDDARAPSGELLVNGGFTDDLSGWTVINPTGGTAPVYSGIAGGVRLNSNDETAGGDGISQQFSTVVGGTYSTSVDLAQNGVNPGDHTVLIEVLDDNGTVIDSVTRVIGIGESDTVDIDFVALSATSEIRITNPSSTATGGTDVVIEDVSVTGSNQSGVSGDDTLFGNDGDDLIVGGGGDDSIDGGADNDSIYGDDVRSPDSSLLTNGGFEGDLSGWTVINPLGGTAPVYSGSAGGIRLNSNNEAAGGDGISQQFGTVVGQTYSTSVDLVQNGNDPGSHDVFVQILDENGTEIDSFTTTIVQNGSDTVEIDFVATTATSEIRITNPSSTGTVGTDVVITDVSVTGLDPVNVIEGGNDTIDGGAGDDLIVAGSGADSIDGGADNDTIYGDGDVVRESLTYEGVTTQQAQDGFTVNTGNVNVTFSSPTETNITLASLTTTGDARPYTGGIIDDGNGVDPDSVIQSNASSTTSLGEYNWVFTEPVSNVSFNITDLDNNENVQIFAFDANNNPVEVSLTPGSNVTVSDSNGDGIDDLAEGSGILDPIDASQAVTVNIPGPVVRIEAVQTIDTDANLGIQFTEMFFDVLTPGTNGDNDSIGGGAGNDVIYGEGGDDTLDGGTGNDTLDGGTGSDTIQLSDSFGSDTITGGEDADDADIDLIDASALTGSGVNVSVTGESGTLTQGANSAGFSEIESFTLTEQADTITAFGVQDFDVDAGGGDDLIQEASGLNTIDAGTGNDTIISGFGESTIVGGEDLGNGDVDTLDFQTADDVVTILYDGDESATYTDDDGDSGEFSQIEALNLSDGADSVNAGADTSGVIVSGNQGDDTITGGSGGDSITGGQDADSLTGGLGDDTFVYNTGDGLDTITDFNAGNTGTLNDGDSSNNDFIDLSSRYDHLFELWADQADDGILNQSNDLDTQGNAVDYTDNAQFNTDAIEDNEGIIFAGATAGSSFFNAENTGVVCFVRGTRIRTPKGEVEVQNLRVGDTVLTQDNGAQKIRCIVSSRVPRTDKLQPIRIAPGALGEGIPNRALFVSPQHRMLIRSAIVERMTGSREVFVIAKKLTDMPGIHTDTRDGHVRYFHLLCDNHEIVFANGAPAETLLPGPQAQKMMSPDAWEELTAIFPEIEVRLDELKPARPVIRAKRKDNLTRRHRRNGVALVEPFYSTGEQQMALA